MNQILRLFLANSEREGISEYIVVWDELLSFSKLSSSSETFILAFKRNFIKSFLKFSVRIIYIGGLYFKKLGTEEKQSNCWVLTWVILFIAQNASSPIESSIKRDSARSFASLKIEKALDSDLLCGAS